MQIIVGAAEKTRPIQTLFDERKEESKSKPSPWEANKINFISRRGDETRCPICSKVWSNKLGDKCNHFGKTKKVEEF